MSVITTNSWPGWDGSRRETFKASYPPCHCNHSTIPGWTLREPGGWLGGCAWIIIESYAYGAVPRTGPDAVAREFLPVDGGEMVTLLGCSDISEVSANGNASQS